MNRDELVEYCLAKPGAEESYPWGEEELVAKVGGKGFAFIGPGSFSVKCGRDAADAGEWRDRYPGAIDVQGLPRNELADLITQMNEQMLAAARELQFEVAARLRDELTELKKELRQMKEAGLA